MTSKLTIKPSRKDRPRSSDKLGASKVGRKSKDAGTPEKVLSPMAMAGQREMLTDSPLLPLSVTEEEIKSLRINPDDLKSSVVPTPPKTEKRSSKILIRKKIPVQSLPKQQKNIVVARRAPSDADIKLPNPDEYPGLRIDKTGKVVPHTILGSVENFMQQAFLEGNDKVTSLPIPGNSQSPWPENVDQNTAAELDKMRQVHINETRALDNWEKQMKLRRKEQKYLSDTMGVSADMLLMNQDEDFRAKHEERTLVDRAIPSMDYGKGYRVGSEFWKQVENIGGDFGINMTLTQTERGYAPPVEHIGKPARTKQMMGTDWQQNKRLMYVHYPWLKSQYLHDRKQQLNEVIDELMPHRPYVDGLEVIGQSVKNVGNLQGDQYEENNNIEYEETFSELDEENGSEQELLDPLAAYEDVVPLPIFGPSLTINGYSASWNGSDTNKENVNGIDIRLQFESPSGENAFNSVDISNDGTAAVYYSWRRIVKKDPFGIKSYRPLQRFYFDMRNGVILPNDNKKIQFSFKSPNAGIFNETWQLETQPVLCGGAAVNVILRGVATQEDITENDRKKLEEELEYKQKQTFINRIVEEILNGVRTPPRPSSPIDSYITEEEMFARQNEKMIFNAEAINGLKGFHEQLNPEAEWDMSIDNLLKKTRTTDDEEIEESLLQKLNSDIESFAFPKDRPVEKDIYNGCYQLLCEAMDKFYGSASTLAQSMGLPSKEFVVEVQQEEVSKKGKKNQNQESQKGTPDKKLDAKKKDNRPTSSVRGRASASQKAKSKETFAPTMTTPKQTNSDVAAEKNIAVKKVAVQKTAVSFPMSARFNDSIYIQLYDILDDVVGRMEETVLASNSEQSLS